MLFHFLALPAVAFALVASPRQSGTSCSNPVVRKEWRSLSPEDRAGYIDAVHCLAKKPSVVAGLNSTRYDDFPRIHNSLDKQSESLTGKNIQSC